MIRTIFFDFGNVLYFFDHFKTVRRLCAFTDASPEELFGHLYGNRLEDDYEAGRITTEQYVAAARDAGRLRCSHEQFVAAFGDVFTPNEPVLALLPGLARHHRLVLASNTNDAHFSHFSAAYREALAPFHHLCTSHRAGARKPRPEFFAHCQRFAGAEPGECLFVDDLPANVEGARRHGWNGMVYAGPADLRARLREIGVRGLDDGRGELP